MFQLAARFVTNQSVYIALCSRNNSLMVVTISTRTVTFFSKIVKYRKLFLISFKYKEKPYSLHQVEYVGTPLQNQLKMRTDEVDGKQEKQTDGCEVELKPIGDLLTPGRGVNAKKCKIM